MHWKSQKHTAPTPTKAKGWCLLPQMKQNTMIEMFGKNFRIKILDYGKMLTKQRCD